MSGRGGPRLARWLVRALLPSRDVEYILGDMEELHRERALRRGRWSADGRYWRDALASIRARRPRSRSARGARSGGAGRPPAHPLRDMGSDLVRVHRLLRREPGFVALVVLTLALGVGSSGAVFGMINELLLRPLPGVSDPAGAAYLTFHRVGEPDRERGLSLPDLEAVRRGATLLDGMASYGLTVVRLARGDERPVSGRGNAVYGDFFEVLEVRAAEGRLLRAEDTRLGADPRVTVISEDLRARLFAPGETVVGRTLRLDGEAFTVIGVAGGGFRGPERGDAIDLWIPLGAYAVVPGVDVERLTSRNSVMHEDIVVRARPGVDPAAVEAQVAGLIEHLAATEPESAEWLSPLRPRLSPGLHLPPSWRASTYGSLRLLGAVVLLVLLIACANVANLFLFRNIARRGAFATRRALGASSGRIARQQIAESFGLGLLGALAGLGAAWLIALPFRGHRLILMPAFEGFVIDGRVLAFAGALVVATTLLFGVVPAVLAGRFDLGSALKDAGGRDTRGGAWLRRLVSAAQVALCLTLLVGALLLQRSIRNLYAVDTGYDLEGVVSVAVDAREASEGRGHAELERLLLDAVEAVPGVTGAALDVYGPHGARMMGRAGLPGVAPRDAPAATTWNVSPGWFDVVGVELVSGRAFRPDDGARGDAAPVILTASLARRIFGDADPVGRTVSAGFYGMTPREVVGVSRDLRSAYAPDEAEDGFFVPFGSMDVPYATVLARVRSADAGTLRALREAVEAVLPDQPVPDPEPAARVLEAIHSERLLFRRLLGLLSGLAVALSAVGLYGVIAFAAAGRTREFGIRVALGAEAGRIARLVLGDAFEIVVVGTGAGLLGAWLLARLLESRLYGVTPEDPLSYGAAVLLLATAAALACWHPAHLATRADPVETLRRE